MHACSACQDAERPRLRAAAARAAGRLRERRPPSQLHPRRRRDRAHPVGRQPADARPRGAARRGAVPAPAPRPRADRGGRRASTRRRVEALGRLDRATRESQRSERAQDRRGDDDARLRRPLADPAPGELRRRPSRRRRAHLGQQRARQPRARRRRHRRSAIGPSRRAGAGRRRAPVRRDGLAGVQPAPAAAAASAARRARPISPPTPCCAWSPTAATSCRTGACGCRR